MEFFKKKLNKLKSLNTDKKNELSSSNKIKQLMIEAELRFINKRKKIKKKIKEMFLNTNNENKNRNDISKGDKKIIKFQKKNKKGKINNKLLKKIKRKAKIIIARKIMEYNDEEINNLSYEKAIINDKRTYMQYYISLIKTKHPLIFSFFNNTDYNIKAIKIDLFLFNFALEYTVNALFFSDEIMHTIYEDEGKFDFIYQLPQTIYSLLISIIIGNLAEKFALTEDSILDYKSQKIKENLKKEEFRLFRKIKIKLILYFIFNSLFLLCFWYYLAIFCAVCHNTQFHLIKDILISFVIVLIQQFLICFLPGILRIPSLSDKKSNRRGLYKFSKFIQML